ncbi:hypothetical protein EV188_10935 [Actinomycetospora succinea]|uniref:Glutamine synthetase-like protein n=1 Tax=Actinomycetospora succinea TaxID=663603 RepID=A0A4V6PWT6_9PSEU|nr:hypothetical protein EV188_10935 [Actinomycetospora succinea]
MQAVLAPTVNSYKRTGATSTRSGATSTAPPTPIGDAHEVGAVVAAVGRAARHPVVTGGLDAAGPGVAEYFATRKREEFFDWHGTVGPWEHDQYLTAF